MKKLLDFTFSMSPCHKIMARGHRKCKLMVSEYAIMKSKESTTPKARTSVYSNNKKGIVCSLHYLYIKDKVHETP